MNVTRRQFLTLSGIAAAASVLGACAPARTLVQQASGQGAVLLAAPNVSSQTWRVLSRMTFAPRVEEIIRANEIGLNGWIEEQLAWEAIGNRAADLRTRGIDTLWMDPDLVLNVRQDAVKQDLKQAALLRAIYSPRQLYEIMVEFWTDHFNIAQDKLDCAWLKVVDDREVIRKHALGNFFDLLWASMHSPAMLHYLDNQDNFQHSPNENYARELLELHSLGVDAGYTQKDVRETARCLTGWTVNEKWRRGRFEFDGTQHDQAAKTVLGVTISANGGEADGERVFDAIRAHPATPRFIARKLVRRFVADEPPAALVEKTAKAFTESNGDIQTTLRVILFSDEMQNASAAMPKYKRPLHVVAGALRQLNVETNAQQPLMAHLDRMGQPLFQWAMPDGFPDYARAWQNNLLSRWQFALALASDAINDTRTDWEGLRGLSADGSVRGALEAFSARLLGGELPGSALDTLSDALRDVPDESAVQTAVAVLIASPQYQWR